MSEHHTPEEIGESIYKLVFQAGHAGATTIVRSGQSDLSIRDWVVEHIRRIETKTEAAEGIAYLSQTLIDKLDEIFADPTYQAVFKSARDQGCAYYGPNCDAEIKALAKAIAAYGDAL